MLVVLSPVLSCSLLFAITHCTVRASSLASLCVSHVLQAIDGDHMGAVVDTSQYSDIEDEEEEAPAT